MALRHEISDRLLKAFEGRKKPDFLDAFRKDHVETYHLSTKKVVAGRHEEFVIDAHDFYNLQSGDYPCRSVLTRCVPNLSIAGYGYFLPRLVSYSLEEGLDNEIRDDLEEAIWDGINLVVTRPRKEREEFHAFLLTLSACERTSLCEALMYVSGVDSDYEDIVLKTLIEKISRM